MRLHKIVRTIGSVFLFIGIFSQNPMHSVIGLIVVIGANMLQGDYLEKRLGALKEDKDETEETPAE